MRNEIAGAVGNTSGHRGSGLAEGARGWPVIKGIADFWTNRVVQRPDGYHVLRVSGADECARDATTTR